MQPTKHKGGGGAHAIRSARSASMVVPWSSPLRMHVSRSAGWRTATRLAGKWFVFARKKKNEKAAWRETMASPLGESSLFFSLSFSFSFFLSLSLSRSLFLSLSLSLSQGALMQKQCRVNAYPYGGPTDFVSNCIQLGGWDLWSIVTEESTHNPPGAPKASPMPENWRHASRTTINQQVLEHDDDDWMQNCTRTWTARKSTDTIPDTRDVLRPLSLTIDCWRSSSLS